MPGFEWNNRKVLVTGASGFKGSWLCAVLLELGAEVHGTVRNQRRLDAAFWMLSVNKRVIQSGPGINPLAGHPTRSREDTQRLPLFPIFFLSQLSFEGRKANGKKVIITVEFGKKASAPLSKRTGLTEFLSGGSYVLQGMTQTLRTLRLGRFAAA